MASLGSYLRELREDRGLSLEDLCRATRVAPRYLEALEGDDLGALPGHVFARGFLRAYCQALGVSPDEAIAYWQGVLRRVTETDRWRTQYLDRFALTPFFRTGEEVHAFLTRLEAVNRDTLRHLGVAAGSN